jgi:endonuclease YncB( thermonuclease family)
VRVLEATYCTARKLGFVPSVCKPVRETHLGIVGLTRGSILFVALHLFLWPVSDLGAQEPAEVVSAETLRIGDRLYRLHGVDAPEPDQQCWLTSRLYRCSEIAEAALMDLVAGSADVRCEPLGSDWDGDGAILARCFSEGYDLSEGMTYTGWAMADPRTGERYRRFQEDAEKAGRGLWRGRFVMPWEWRVGKRLPEETATE